MLMPRPKQKTYDDFRTKLDRALSEALNLYEELRTLRKQRKLTAKAMVAEALAQADCDARRVEALRLEIDRPGLDAVRAFVRAMTKFYASPTCSRATLNPARALTAYGNPETAAAIAEMPAKTAEMMALATTLAAEAHPDAFGGIEDFEAHYRRVADLEARVDAYVDRFEKLVCGDDLVFEFGDLTTAERDRGLARAHFRRHPSVPMTRGWAISLLEVAYAKRKRRSDRQEPTPTPTPEEVPEAEVVAVT
jgi:hypothetical protein